jgi:RNA polymerase sigma-70 factor (ECF subfamily)
MGDDFICKLHSDGALAYPEVVVGSEAFREYCVRVLGEFSNPETAFHGAELYLCCACAAKDPTAMAILERSTANIVKGAIARVSADPEFVRETLQESWDQLLAGPHPKIASYSGRGSLRAWLRVVATRVALDRLRARRQSHSRRVELADYMAESWRDPETQTLRKRYTEAFQDALREAVLELTPQERLLLRLTLQGRCSIHDIGRIYGVHRATAARWLERARAHVLDAAHERIAGSLRMTRSEFKSMVREVRSGIDLSWAFPSSSGCSTPDWDPLA